MASAAPPGLQSTGHGQSGASSGAAAAPRGLSAQEEADARAGRRCAEDWNFPGSRSERLELELQASKAAAEYGALASRMEALQGMLTEGQLNQPDMQDFFLTQAEVHERFHLAEQVLWGHAGEMPGYDAFGWNAAFMRWSTATTKNIRAAEVSGHSAVGRARLASM